jgi:hypothetical protein
MNQKEEIHETEDRASVLIRDWYYDAERKNQSGVDGGKPGISEKFFTPKRSFLCGTDFSSPAIHLFPWIFLPSSSWSPS